MVSTSLNPSTTQVIAIDGPAGAGKSTVAKKLAHALGFSYLDTGAMYRALTLKALRARIDLTNENQIVELARTTQIDTQSSTQGMKIFLDAEDVTHEIRTLEVTNNTFYVAQAPRVREIMVQWQRAVSAQQSVVVEGRDIGTVVFPQAQYKFYLDADLKERSRRRIKELREKGKDVDAEKLASELQERDRKDQTRDTGPLKKAPDAILIDSTDLTIDGVVEEILKHIRS